MNIDVDWLRANHTMVHYFGLGFIQLKIDQYKRYHFYTDELPQIVGEEEIHNHRYSFQSTVMRGRLKQELFGEITGDTHIMEDESCQEGVVSEKDPSRCGIFLSSVHTYIAGCNYYINHTVFHRVKAVNCVTYLQRGDYKKKYAQVIRPVGAQKVCPFSYKVEDKKLWEIIEAMCKPTV